MNRDELIALAQQAGGTYYAPPPMRAVRGVSFTYEQLQTFAALLVQARGGRPLSEQPAPPGGPSDHTEPSELDIETQFGSAAQAGAAPASDEEGHFHDWPNEVVCAMLNVRQDMLRLRELADTMLEHRSAERLRFIAQSLEYGLAPAERFMHEEPFPQGPVAGYVIAHTDGKRWRTLDSIGMPDFTEDIEQAFLFRRREHADCYACDDPEDVRIVPVPQPEVSEVDQRQAGLYRWLRERLLGADFAWGDPPTPVLVFRLPDGVAIGADLDATIERAQALPEEAIPA